MDLDHILVLVYVYPMNFILMMLIMLPWLLLLCIQENYSHGFHFHDTMGHLVYYEMVCSSFIPPKCSSNRGT